LLLVLPLLLPASDHKLLLLLVPACMLTVVPSNERHRHPKGCQVL
jgi:hypothetical protein